MPDITDTPQTTKTAKKPATRSAQDARIANNIADARTLVSQTQADSALVAKLTARGFPATRLTALVALVDAAQSAFDARQQAMGARQSAVALTQSAYQETYPLFVELRDSARLAYLTERSAWLALGAVGRIPTDSDKFQTAVRAALTSATSAPYKAALAAVGFTDTKHAALTASLDTHETRRVASDTAKRDALTATAARDSTYKALGTGLLPLKRTLKLIEKSG